MSRQRLKRDSWSLSSRRTLRDPISVANLSRLPQIYELKSLIRSRFSRNCSSHFVTPSVLASPADFTPACYRLECVFVAVITSQIKRIPPHILLHTIKRKTFSIGSNYAAFCAFRFCCFHALPDIFDSTISLAPRNEGNIVKPRQNNDDGADWVFSVVLSSLEVDNSLRRSFFAAAIPTRKAQRRKFGE